MKDPYDAVETVRPLPIPSPRCRALCGIIHSRPRPVSVVLKCEPLIRAVCLTQSTASIYAHFLTFSYIIVRPRLPIRQSVCQPSKSAGPQSVGLDAGLIKRVLRLPDSILSYFIPNVLNDLSRSAFSFNVSAGQSFVRWFPEAAHVGWRHVSVNYFDGSTGSKYSVRHTARGHGSAILTAAIKHRSEKADGCAVHFTM